MTTGISWTQDTWNPLAGCTPVGPGCDNCYAARDSAGRLRNHPLYTGLTDETGAFNGTINLAPDRLTQPLRWKRGRLIFVNSMSDLWHQSIPSDYLVQVLGVMAAANQHVFQVLTKRPKDMKRRLTNDAFLDEVDTARLSHQQHLGALFGLDPDWPRPNWWLGVSIENRDYLWRARVLRETPAAVRWLSLEPLLARPGDLAAYLTCGYCGHTRRDHMMENPRRLCSGCMCTGWTGIDWVVVGGESGDRARPMDPGWAREIRDLCADHEIPFHFKQWGRWIPYQPTAQQPFWLGQDGVEEDGHVFPGDLSEGRPTYGWWAPPWADGLDDDRGPADPIVFRSSHGRIVPKPATLDGVAHQEYPPCPLLDSATS